jgi:hypothetical protein
MSGFLSFLFLLLVIWLLLHCVHAFVRLIGESLFSGGSHPNGARTKRIRFVPAKTCSNALCRKDNRADAQFCARCGQPLGSRAKLPIHHAC